MQAIKSHNKRGAEGFYILLLIFFQELGKCLHTHQTKSIGNKTDIKTSMGSLV